MVTKFLNIDTDNTLSANSNERVPSQKAVKVYTDNLAIPKQNKVLDTPITIESTEETTVEGALGAINTSLSNKQNQSLSSAITVDGTQQTTVEGTLNALNIYVNSKQDTLVSGTNIKTVNGNSLLGSGNVAVDSLPSQTGQNGKFLTTNGINASWVDVPIPQDVYTQDNLVAGTNISFTQVPQPVIDVNTIALWHLDDSLNDVISGITLGGKLTTEFHKFGTGAGYEVNEYASGFSDWTTSVPGINFLTDSFTIDGWVYFGSNGNRIFFGAGYLSGYNFCGTGILLKQSSARALVNHTGDDSAAAATVNLTESGWYHLAVQQDYDNQKIRFFLNGTMFHEATARCQSIYGNTTVNIANPANDVRYDEIRVSNVARYPASGFTPFNQPYSNDAPPIYEVNCTLEALPDQNGQNGKFLTTDGTDASWADIPTEVDNKSVSLNSSDQIQAIGLINQRDTTSATKEWIGTKAQYDAILSKDANTQYIVTDDDETTTYVNDYHIGQIFQSVLPISSYALHLLDGSLISGSGMYEDFVNYIGGLYTDDPTASYFTTEADWQTAVTTYGVCGKFVYTAAAGGSPATVRLPKYNSKIFSGGGNAPVIGTGIGVGLTDGIDNMSISLNSGKAITSNNQYGQAVGTDASGSPTNAGKVVGLTTSASNSGMIADLTQITTSLDGYWYIVVANSYQTPTGIQISQIASDLNGKADKDLTNCTKPYVTETYQSGTSWYRVWSNGWCEQGGYGTHVSPYTITFLKEFRDTDYTLLFSQFNTYGSIMSPASKTTTGFQSGANTGSGQEFYWMACGYIA